MADVEPRHGILCSMTGDRCRSPHCRACGGVADAQGFCPTCPREQGPHAPDFVLITPDTSRFRTALGGDRPRLLIVCEFKREGEQYALELGLPHRAAFEIITYGHQLVGRAGIYRVVGLPVFECNWVLERATAAGRLREATDDEVAAVIAAWTDA